MLLLLLLIYFVLSFDILFFELWYTEMSLTARFVNIAKR